MRILEVADNRLIMQCADATGLWTNVNVTTVNADTEERTKWHGPVQVRIDAEKLLDATVHTVLCGGGTIQPCINGIRQIP